MSAESNKYIGRFAPSPTGPLHLGSLIAALASYLDARHVGGRWLLRMEDLDPPREQPAAAQSILHSLQHHGLQWDDDVLWQSKRHQAYDDALTALTDRELIFYCNCTRQQLGADGSCQSHCRQRQHRGALATRLDVPAATTTTFVDRIQGRHEEALGRAMRDFVVKRKDGLYAYQLAVVVDDAFQGITHIVRGSDIMDSTARQLYLQTTLGVEQPVYAHIPVLTNDAGQKLSKQNHAPALDDTQPADNLRRALTFLNQTLPPQSLTSPAKILTFSAEHWAIDQVPTVMAGTEHCPG